ncbi:MAG: carboxypeptidase regulatory-like domain-containing protein [Terracidiphilus sp.]
MFSAQNSGLAIGVKAGYRACLIAIAIVLLGGSPAAYAQSIFATLSGTVTDSNGALITGAHVTVVNTATSIVQHLVSNKEGYFSATDLPVGTYNVSVQAKGFEKWDGTGIVLNASDVRTLTIPLKVGAESVTVEVSATADQIDITDSGAKTETITEEDLEKQPLIGRNATEILRIIPGAAMITLSGTNRPAADGSMIGINGFTVNGNAGGMAAVSINGQSNTGLSINQDGQNVEDPGAPGAATPVNPNPDMISEIQVMTSNYGAENAKGPVVINTMSKSGGSEFHGDAYFYARNSELNAEESNNKQQEVENSYSKGYLKIPSHYYYPGATLGGPVIIPHTRFNNKNKTKLFFHESFEDYRQLIDGGINNAFVPTADMIKTGDFSALGTPAYTNVASPAWNGATQPDYTIGGRYGVVSVPQNPTDAGLLAARPGCTITNGVMAPACIDPDAQLWLQDSLPTANLSAPNSAGWNYVEPVTQSQNSWHNMAKLDMNFSDSTKMYISQSHQQESAVEPLGLWVGSGDWVVPSPTADLSNNTSDLWTLNFLHIFSPTLTAEAHIGYTHMDMPGGPQNPAKVLRSQMNFPTPLKGVFGNPNAPVVTSWSGSIPNIGDIGHDYHPAFYAEKGIPSTGADVTKVFRTHTLKFGFLWEHIYNAQDAWSQYMGVFNYGFWSRTFSQNNYADILMGASQGYYEQALPPVMHMEQSATSFYATDHWKLNSHITLDYGMRFEHYAAPDADDQYGLAVFNESKYGAAVSAGTENPGVSWHSIDSSTSKTGNSETYLVYSPRVGASIDIFGNGKTVVRGGWGMYRYETNLQDDHLGAANTAVGSVGWSAPSAASTWEQVDQFAGNGTSCAAAQPGGIDAGHTGDCAPTVVFGKPTNSANGSITALDTRDKDQPYTVTYSLNIDQQLPKKFFAEISYVGNYSTKGQSGVNMDPVPIGAMTSATVATTCSDLDMGATNPDQTRLGDSNCQQRFRKYPYYQSINVNESDQVSQYDSLQGKLTRSSGWSTINFNYAFAKNLGNPTESGAYPDWGKKEYWTVLNISRKQVFNASYVFSTPKVHFDNLFLNGAANGYQLSGITQIQSGAQLSAVNGYYYDLTNGPSAVYSIGSPDATVAPVITCDPSKGLQKHQFANPNCFAFPTSGTSIGNTRMPGIVGPMYWSSDIAAQKSFAIKEHQNVEFRFTAKNFLNHDLLSFTAGDPNLTLNFSPGGSGNPPLGTLENATDTKDACPGVACKAFGFANTNYGHRTLELSVKYNF